jgi:hypothetical protein
MIGSPKAARPWDLILLLPVPLQFWQHPSCLHARSQADADLIHHHHHPSHRRPDSGVWGIWSYCHRSIGEMMLKDLAAIQQHHHQQQLAAAAADENMSNLTSASGDQASVSSHPVPPPAKKKRSLPGNPGQPFPDLSIQ